MQTPNLEIESLNFYIYKYKRGTFQSISTHQTCEVHVYDRNTSV